MSVRSAQSITQVFTTRRFDTGAATNADSLPTGTLYVNGTADAASVTITNITTGVYKFAVTLPTLALNDEVSMRINAVVNSVTDNGIVWQDTKDFFAGSIPDVVAGGVGGIPLSVDSAGRVDVLKINGTSQTARDIGLSVLISVGTGTGQINIASGKVPATVAAGDLATDSVNAAALATDAVVELRNAITGGAYALNTDSGGNVKISDGTGANQIDTNLGAVAHVNLVDTNTDMLTATAVWAAATRLLTAGTNIVLAKGVGITGFNDIAATDVWAAGTRSLTALGFTLAAADLASSIITAAKFATDAIDSNALAASAAQEIRNAVTGGAYALDTDANGRIRIVDGTGAGEIDTSSGAIAHVLLADVTTTNTDMISAVTVKAQAVAALATDTYALPGQITPSTTPTLAAAIMQLFQSDTNPYDQDSATQRLYNRAGSVVHQKRAVSELAGTVSLGALVTGP